MAVSIIVISVRPVFRDYSILRNHYIPCANAHHHGDKQMQKITNPIPAKKYQRLYIIYKGTRARRSIC